MKEAELERGVHGLAPQGEGWFVVHAEEARWIRSERYGVVTDFEGEQHFPQTGVNIHVVEPGQRACLYHREEGQEDFLVLAGECILVVEEEERRLRAGHFVHCPPRTTHVFVGTGGGPCAILMIGHRPAKTRLCYPVSAAAAEYGASVETETTDPRVAYGDAVGFDEVEPPAWPIA